MRPWQKILSYAGGITTLVVCLELLMPYVFTSVGTTQVLLSTPRQIEITDSLVHSYASRFTIKMHQHDSALNVIFQERAAAHMFQVGLQADTNHVLWYRDQFNEIHRALYDTTGRYYYVKSFENEIQYFYCFKKNTHERR